jgi:hypothetical protein
MYIIRYVSPKILIILAQIFRDNNAEFENKSYAFLILIMIYLARKIAKNYSMLAQIFIDKNAYYE